MMEVKFEYGTFMFSWIDLLKEYGDPIERRGASETELMEFFPCYAELWGKFIYLRRDKNDPSKLSSDVTTDIEYIFNNHYGVFYQLTFAFKQLPYLYSDIIDVGTPLVHLASASDLVQRTILALFKVRNIVTFQEMSEEKYQEETKKFWKEKYHKDFKGFQKTYRPVTLKLHNIESHIQQNLVSYVAFRQASDVVREYRNIFVHSLSPLKLKDESRILLPLPQYLERYKHSLWSSKRNEIDPTHCEAADTLIPRLAKDLVIAINDLWGELLDLLRVALPFDERELRLRIISSIGWQSGESGAMPLAPGTASGVTPYYGGSAEYPYVPISPTHGIRNSNSPAGTTNVSESPTPWKIEGADDGKFPPSDPF